jgi:hypothetical protein
MPLSTDITLPKDQTPVFPDKCIVCHAPRPGSAIHIAQNSTNALLSLLLPIATLFGWSRVRIPICQSCKPKFRLQRWGREVICWTLAGILIWWLYPHFKDWTRLTQMLAVVGVLTVGLAPVIFAEVAWPRFFDTTASGDTVDYEFASAAYAEEFLIRNNPAYKASSPVRPDPGSAGLCVALLREGWKCHRFPDSEVVVVLPHDFIASFDAEGVLYGTLDGEGDHFSATLHSRKEMRADPTMAYGFLDHLAAKSSVTPTDKGTYRYFRDPKQTGDESLQYTFHVVAIPGAVVVISIASPPGEERPEMLARIEAAIPDLVGELV